MCKNMDNYNPMILLSSQTDWNDGQLICELVRAVGGKISNTSGTNEEVLKKGKSENLLPYFKEI